jgi:putative methylase
MQKRLLRKKDIELLLSQIEPHPSPKVRLEQYTIPENVAATALYIAAYVFNDVVDKTVLDLGCGTGRLALGARFLGAKQVVGIDIDKTAIKVAQKNSYKIGLKKAIQWIIADIDMIQGRYDTVLMNPPFGIQNRKADRKFLKKALNVGKAIYSFHKHPNRKKRFMKNFRTTKHKILASYPSPFLKKYIENHGGEIKKVYSMLMKIPHMFKFHTKQKHEFIVDFYIITKT